MGLIQALAFIECFAVNGNKVSISEPTPDDRAKSLHKEILACVLLQQSKKVILADMHTENHLPFNPKASATTDDNN